MLKTFCNPETLEVGIDEAGRGPLFGRVYIGACILHPDDNNPLIKCKLSTGVNCNDPRAYQASLNELSVIKGNERLRPGQTVKLKEKQ